MTAPIETGDRVALVTGAARGIGAATVTALVDAGWSVVATDVCADDPRLPYPLATRADLDSVAAADPDRIVPVVADVRSTDALRAAVSGAVDRFGRLDAAIGCAGVLGGGDPVWATGDDTWDAQMEVNLAGVWNLAVAAVPLLLQSPSNAHGRGHASFTALASAAGTSGRELLGAYAASKHGVIGLVRSMAAELGPTGVTANTVSPGSTRTSLLDASAAVYELPDPEEFGTHHLLDRLVEPDEVAATIVYLCSDAAAAITGANIAVDAGMTAHGG